MARNLKLLSIPFAIIGSTLLQVQSLESRAGIISGADIYCVMRAGGNEHEESWSAAYQAIKNKKEGLFKTSPKQAAFIITETVVADPEKYNDCIEYLGDIYASPSSSIENNITKPSEKESNKKETDKGFIKDRYSY